MKDDVEDKDPPVSLVSNKDDQLRAANKTNMSTWDRVYKHFHSDSKIELRADEKIIVERWEKAWLLLCRHRTRNKVALVLQKLFNVSRSVAFDDVRNAMNLFSDPREDMKAAKRAIAEDGILKGADKAWKNDNLEMHEKYMKQYIELNGLKEADAETNMAELLKKLVPTQVILNFNKSDVDGEIEKLRGKVLDITHEDVEE